MVTDISLIPWSWIYIKCHIEVMIEGLNKHTSHYHRWCSFTTFMETHFSPVHLNRPAGHSRLPHLPSTTRVSSTENIPCACAWIARSQLPGARSIDAINHRSGANESTGLPFSSCNKSQLKISTFEILNKTR